MEEDLFPTDITPEEQQAGFSLIQVRNPKGLYGGQPPTVSAVCKQLGSGLLAVKVFDSLREGEFVYAIRQAGGLRPARLQQPASSLEELVSRFP